MRISLSWIVAASVLACSYVNGVTGSVSIVAPVVSTRALAPRKAVWLATVATVVSPFVFGLSVAHAFSAGVLQIDQTMPLVVLSAALGATVWGLLTWRFGIPSSSSHALLGGLIGAGFVSLGIHGIQWRSLAGILASLFVTPALGLAAGFLTTHGIYWLARDATPRISRTFQRAQILTAIIVALSYGANDGQKTIGLFALGLGFAARGAGKFPLWVVALPMAAGAMGTLAGGWRVVRRLGGGFYKIRPIHGLGAQVAAAGVTFAAALLGGPASSTQVLSTAILGAGAADRISKVRWTAATDIVWTWFLTIPATAVIGALSEWTAQYLLRAIRAG